MKQSELRQLIREEISKVVNEDEGIDLSKQDYNPYKGKKYKTLRNPFGVQAGLIGTVIISKKTNISTGKSTNVFAFLPDNRGNVYGDFPMKYLKQI